MNKVLIALVLLVGLSGNVFADCIEKGRTVTNDVIYECSGDHYTYGAPKSKICSQERDRNGNRIEVCKPY